MTNKPPTSVQDRQRGSRLAYHQGIATGAAGIGAVLAAAVLVVTLLAPRAIPPPAVAATNYSAPPAFMTDHQSPTGGAATNYSAPPPYAQDHLDAWK